MVDGTSVVDGNVMILLTGEGLCHQSVNTFFVAAAPKGGSVAPQQPLFPLLYTQARPEMKKWASFL